MVRQKFLVTGATGTTGVHAVELLLARGHQVRALAHREDDRSKQLQELGAEVVIGDLLKLNDVRLALNGIRGAYFVYPLSPTLVQATAIFAQAAKKAEVEIVANMSQWNSRPSAKSPATMNHWLSEQIFDWSPAPVAHLRPTFFCEWLLWVARSIRQGVMMMPWDANWTHRRERATDGNKDMASFRLTIRHWHSRAFLPDFKGSQPRMKAKRAGSRQSRQNFHYVPPASNI